MADLNVSLILRLVDRLSAPARIAAASVNRISSAQSAFAKAANIGAKAAEAATLGNAALSKSADLVSTATGGAGRAAESTTRIISQLGATTNRTAEEVAGSARVIDSLASANANAGRSAEQAARRFGMFERAQLRGRAAGRMLGSEMDSLNSKLNKLAMGSIVADGMTRAGRSIWEPIKRSVEKAAEFQRGMTGIGILGDLTPQQLAPVQSNIISSAQRYAIPIQTMQQDDMAVLNEGVYRKGRDLIEASQSAARLSLLSDIGGAPITGSEAGGLIATYAHSMLAPAKMLDRLNATIFRASQIGGDKVGDAARFLPEIMGQMKARAFGNYQGFVDANAALQITKCVTGNDEAAGTDVRDLMINLNHMLTDRRFKKEGMDLEKIIAQANKVGESPLVAAVNAIMKKIGSSSTDPELAGKLGKYFQNQQAATAALAIIINQRDTSAGPGFDSFRKLIADPSALTSYYAAIQRASTGSFADLTRLANARQQIAISTGTILFPAMNLLAGAMTRVANLVTRFEARGGLLAKAAIYAASGVGLLALGAGGLGSAIIGVVGPLMIANSLFKLMPLATKVAEGRLASLALRYGVATGATRAFSGGLTGLATRALPAVATALRGVSLAVLADPLTWPIVAGVAAVAGAALVVRKYWQPISAFFRGVWSGVSEGLAPVATQLAGAGRSVAAAVAPLRPIWSAIASGISGVWGWLTRLIEPVKETGAQLRSTTDAGRRFGLALVGAGRMAVGFLASLNPLRGGLIGVGGQLMRGLIAGILGMGPAVKKAIIGMGDQVVTWFKGRLGIHSPSRVFASLGDQTIAGLNVGLGRSSEGVYGRLRSLSAGMSAAFGAAALHVGVAVAHPVIPAPRAPILPILQARVAQPAMPPLQLARPIIPAPRAPALPILQARVAQPAMPTLRLARTVLPAPRAPALPILQARFAQPSMPPLQLARPIIPAPRAPALPILQARVAQPAMPTLRLVAMIPEPDEGRGRSAALEHIRANIIATPRGDDRPVTPSKVPVREIHHHHAYQMTFHIDGKHDARQIAREIDKIRRRAMDAALHDGGDDG